MTATEKTCRTCRHWVMPECWRVDMSEGGPEFGCTLWEGVQKST